jgi:anhydro-N-acetylmuramic acid kinase
MSGTSLDAIDGALVRWSPEGPDTLAFTSQAFDPALRAELLALQAPGPDELHRAALAAVGFAPTPGYAELMRSCHITGHRRSGALGRPCVTGPGGYTLQLLNGALLAELTGGRRCDFRSPTAAGGEGAPLVPAFHAAVFGGDAHRVVVNLGGIAMSACCPS